MTRLYLLDDRGCRLVDGSRPCCDASEEATHPVVTGIFTGIFRHWIHRNLQTLDSLESSVRRFSRVAFGVPETVAAVQAPLAVLVLRFSLAMVVAVGVEDVDGAAVCGGAAKT
eukprot:8081032-Pyramimonas_sp.AAC.2